MMFTVVVAAAIATTSHIHQVIPDSGGAGAGVGVGVGVGSGVGVFAGTGAGVEAMYFSEPMSCSCGR